MHLVWLCTYLLSFYQVSFLDIVLERMWQNFSSPWSIASILQGVAMDLILFWSPTMADQWMRLELDFDQLVSWCRNDIMLPIYSLKCETNMLLRWGIDLLDLRHLVIDRTPFFIQCMWPNFSSLFPARSKN